MPKRRLASNLDAQPIEPRRDGSTMHSRANIHGEVGRRLQRPDSRRVARHAQLHSARGSRLRFGRLTKDSGPIRDQIRQFRVHLPSG